MDEETEFDGWASLGARRQAEDEMLIQRYAAGEGRGLDMRPVRGFVQHVRRDLGPKAIICDVTMTVHDVVVWYFFPDTGNGSPAATPLRASVTEVPTRPAEPAAAMPSSNGPTSVPQSSTAAPPSFPARGGVARDPGVAANTTRRGEATRW